MHLGLAAFIMRTPSACSRLSQPNKLFFAFLFSFAVSLGACGGGGSGSPPPPPPSPDFTLTLNPTSISIPAGTSAQTTLSAAPLNGFSGSISVQMSGLPAGVTASLQTFTLPPGAPQSVTFFTNTSTSTTTATLTFTCTSSSLTHTIKLNVSVTPPNNATLSTRTKYVRTDAVVEYYQWVNTHWVVYDAPTSHFFVTDPFSNQVFVFESATRKQIAVISVPGAYGIDETPDQSSLYVGTLIGDVYLLDPKSMSIKKRYMASQIGPFGYQAMIALVLADGRLALLGEAGGIPSVDGSSNIAVWNPTDNSIALYGGANLAGEPSNPLCGNTISGHIFGFALTSDRNFVMTGTGNGLCKLNPATGLSLEAAFSGNTSKIAVSPDGRYLAFPSYPNGAVIVDANTLNQVASFSVAALNASDASLLFSPDSAILYMNDSAFVYAYHVATHQLLGWLPNITVQYTQGGFAVGPPTNPNFGAFDNTGLLAGPMEEGFGFLDTTQLQSGTVGTPFLNNYLNPATGFVSGGTVTQWSVPATINSQSGIFFGQNPVPSFSVSGNFVSVTTPPGQPGPTDVYAFASDGGMQYIPEAFSYGPTILEVTPNLSSAEGGGVGVIYGYGFAPVTATAIPPDLAVTVGGQPVAIVALNINAYGISAQPFLLQSIYYTIPAGTSGTSADVAVSTSSGTIQAAAALTYLPALQKFPLPGASLIQGIYDPIRDVYYFTDANKIQVFSRALAKWMNPVSIPAPAGKTQRLWGISLSPDTTKMAVADASAGVVYLIDPANPTSIKTIPATPTQFPAGVLVLPSAIAITNSGLAYLIVDVQGGTGFHNYFTLDTNTGAITDLGLDGPGLGASDLYLRTTISADNTRAYFNNLGNVFSIDTATGTLFSASTGQGCCYGDYDLTLAPNQVQFEASSIMFDADLNGSADFAFNDREIIDINYVYGTKFSPDGSLLFQPSVQGMDIYDGRTGILRSRAAFSVPLSTNYDALVSDGKDNILLAITGATGNGIAVLDLTTVSEPPPLLYVAAVSSQLQNESRHIDRTVSLQLSGHANAKKNPPMSRPRVIPHVTNSILFSK